MSNSFSHDEDTAPATSGTTAVSGIGAVSETEVTASENQLGVTVTLLEAGRLHWSLQTGVSTSNAYINKGGQIALPRYAGSIFVITAADTLNVQIDRIIQ